MSLYYLVGRAASARARQILPPKLFILLPFLLRLHRGRHNLKCFTIWDSADNEYSSIYSIIEYLVFRFYIRIHYIQIYRVRAFVLYAPPVTIFIKMRCNSEKNKKLKKKKKLLLMLFTYILYAPSSYYCIRKVIWTSASCLLCICMYVYEGKNRRKRRELNRYVY